MEQNIVGLGFDIPAFSSEQKKIIEGLREVYNLSKQIGETSIKPGSTGGYTELKEKIKLMETLTKEQEKLIASQVKLDKAERESQKLKQETLKTDQQSARAASEKEKLSQQEIKTKKQLLSYEQQLQKEMDKGLSKKQAEYKIAAQLTDEYGLLSKALKDQELRYKNLALTHGFETEAAKEALQTALDTRAVLDKLDTNLKNHQRNVGNYKSAFDGLGMSFTQIARELPSLAINIQTFLLAISNNLPMVFDEISKARKEVAALRAEGQQTPGVFERISKSLFSTQVFLSVLVTLLTLFGTKIIESIAGLFNADAALEKYRKRLESVAETQRELIDLQKAFNESVRPSIADVNRAEQELVIAQSLNKSRGDILQIEKKIADARRLAAQDLFLSEGGFDKEAAALDKLLKSELEYNDVLDGISKTKLEQIDLDKPGAKTNGKQFDNVGDYDKEIKRREEIADIKEKQYNRDLKNYETIKKINLENYTSAVALDAKKNEIITYNNEQSLLRETENAKIEAQANIDKNERILADDRNFEKAKVSALKDAQQEKNRIIEQDERKIKGSPENRNADGTYTAEASTALKALSAARIKNNNDTEVAIFRVQEEFRKRRLAAELEISKAIAVIAAAEYARISTSEINSFSDRLIAYGDYYREQQKLIKDDYDFQIATKILTDEELLALQTTTNKKLLDLQIKSKNDLSEIIVSAANGIDSRAAVLDNLKLSEDELKLYNSLKNKEKFAEQAAKKERQLQRETLNNQISTDNGIINSALTTEEAKKAAQRRIYENQTKLNQLELTEEQKKQAKKKALQDVYFELEKVGLNTFFDLAQKISDNYYNKKFQALQKERDMLDENYATQIDNIRRSTVSEQEKAAVITQLTAVQAAQKAKINKEELDARVKQARTNKAITIAEIVAQTALSVVQALPNIPLALLAGVTGAAQLAIAAATQIPTYGEGTDNHPGGPMIVGEKRTGSGYEPELVTNPDGSSFITSKPMLLNALPGTKVKPLGDSINQSIHGSMMSYTAATIADNNGAKLDAIHEATVDGYRMMVKAMRKQKGASVTVNVDSGWGAKISRDIIN